MDKLKVKITCSEPYWWYVNDNKNVYVTEVETEMSLNALFNEIAHEGYRVGEMGHESKIFNITFPNGENIVWKY